MATYKEAYQKSLRYFGGDDLPAKTFVDKYALRDNDGNYLELTPDDMHARLATEFARIESKYPNSLSYDEIYGHLKDFKEIVPQGSPMSAIGNPYQVMSLSNCVVVASPEDSIHSIMDAGKALAQLFKRRCGVGLDLSNLRPDGMKVNNAARTTTGAWSFADYYSHVCRMIGQAGRRGALMETLDVRHPDIFKFVTMKEDLTKVTGANVSVKLNDEFMIAVREDKEFTLRWPVESDSPLFSKVIRARELWDVMIAAVHKSAEPGLLMWDNILRELPAECYADVGFGTVCVNPCAELPLSAYDSCRLLTVNLVGFVRDKFTSKAKFDFDRFAEVVPVAQRLMDDIVDIELEQIDKILEMADSDDEKELWWNLRDRCERGRRTGLGTFALGDALAQLRIPYDSKAGQQMAGEIYCALKEHSYATSIELAKERGAFPAWDWEKEKNNPFLKRLEKKTYNGIKKHGRRNISNLTNAPTGSVAIEAQASSGIEPIFRNVYIRRKKINHDDQSARVDFIDESGDKWQEFPVFHKNVSDWIKMNDPDWDGVTVPELPKYFVTSEDIKWENRVKIQGAIQRHIDHSISSTINLPSDVSLETVSDLYMKSWEEGLKGVTIYVDGSRSGVLITETKDKDGRPTEIALTQAPKRPQVLPCDIYHGKVQGDRWTIVVGLLNGQPYELFGGPSQDVEIPKSAKNGFLTKTKISKNLNKYDLAYNYYNEEVKIEDIGNLFENKTYGTFTRILSLSLRHGAPVQHIVEQLRKDMSEELNSLSNVLSRALKKYIIDGTQVGTKEGCEKCGSSNLRYQEGCPVCLDCAYTKCK